MAHSRGKESVDLVSRPPIRERAGRRGAPHVDGQSRRRQWFASLAASAGLDGQQGFQPAGDEKKWRVLADVFVICIVIIPIVVLMAGLIAVPFVRSVSGVVAPYVKIPLPKTPTGPETTFVYDREGKLLTTLHAGVNREAIPLSQMPESLRDAVIADEDEHFYQHGGLSYQSILRAALADLTHKAIEQGGSTITQQYVKNAYTGGERTIERKIKEAVLAVKLEQKLTKDQILEKYLNVVYFGNGAYGVQAAAQTYFGIPARKLNALQSATLAAVIPAPARYDPKRFPDVAKARRNAVLQRMADLGLISTAEAADLQDRPLKVRKVQHPTISASSYFNQYVSDQLVKSYGYNETFEGGLRVTTTLDRDMQRAAELAVTSNLSTPGDPSAALVAIDPQTGEIRAMVGGLNFNKRKFNLAVQAHRTTGSAAKVFTLVAAMEQHISLDSTWDGPPDIVIDDPRCFDPTKQEPWDVHNYADESAGTMSLASATAHSVNTIFAQLVTVVGPPKVVDVMHRMGIRSNLEPVCSITLGSQAVTPLEMTSAYATLASRGVYHDPRSISTITTASGESIFKADTTGKRVLNANVADLTTWTLEGVIREGTGTRANIGRPAAGKTGTAQDYVDAWFCGYTPQLAACVWVGYPKGEISLHNVEGFANLFGGSIPAMIWHDFMSAALSGAVVVGFHTPDFSTNDVFPEGTFSTEPSPSPSTTPPGGGGGGGGPGPSPKPTLCWPPPHCP
jgi:penicillin-binding protein 1A